MSTTTATETVSNDELTNGMVLFGDNEETVTVEDSYPSSSIPGMVVVETTFGCLYLDNEGQSSVIATTI